MMDVGRLIADDDTGYEGGIPSSGVRVVDFLTN